MMWKHWITLLAACGSLMAQNMVLQHEAAWEHGICNSVEVLDDSLAFIGSGRFVETIDFRDGSVLARFGLPSEVSYLDLDGDRLLAHCSIAFSNDLIVLLDASEPLDLLLIESLEGHTYNVIAAQDGIMCGINGNTCDIWQLEAPLQLSGTLDVGEHIGNVALDDSLVALSYGEELHFYDLHQPALPQYLSAIGIDSDNQTMILRDTLLVADDGDWRIYSLADPLNPMAMGVIPTFTPDQLALDEHRLAAHVLANESALFDFSDPWNVQSIASGVISSSNDLALRGTYVLSAGESRLQVHRAAAPDELALHYQYWVGDSPSGVVPYGDLLYQAFRASFGVFDMSGPGLLAETGERFYKQVSQIDRWQDRLVVHSTSQLALYQLMDPFQPAVQNTLTLPLGNGSSLNGQILWRYQRSALNDSLIAYSIAGPNAPERLGASSLGVQSFVGDIASDGDQLLIATSESALYIDISTPLQPVLLSEWSPDHPHLFSSCDIDGNLGVLQTSSQLLLLSLDPGGPSHEHTIQVSAGHESFNCVQHLGSHLIAGTNKGLAVFWLPAEGAPVLIQSEEIAGGISKLRVDGERVIGQGVYGSHIWTLSDLLLDLTISVATDPPRLATLSWTAQDYATSYRVESSTEAYSQTWTYRAETQNVEWTDPVEMSSNQQRYYRVTALVE